MRTPRYGWKLIGDPHCDVLQTRTNIEMHLAVSVFLVLQYAFVYLVLCSNWTVMAAGSSDSGSFLAFRPICKLGPLLTSREQPTISHGIQRTQQGIRAQLKRGML